MPNSKTIEIIKTLKLLAVFIVSRSLFDKATESSNK